jgi:hypothetical protein
MEQPRFRPQSVESFISETERMRADAKREGAVAVKPAVVGFLRAGNRHMSRSTSLRAGGALLGAVSACSACAVALASLPTAVQPAVWVPRELLVQLHSLPSRYSCDDLERKFRDVLTTLGARRDVRVLAYGCGPASGAAGFSPSVHLHFEIPQVVEGAQPDWSNFDASRTNVRSATLELRPGNPPSLEPGDCSLLRQMKAALIPALSIHVVNYRLACQAPPSAQSRFDLSVAALIPTSAGAARVVSRR